MELTFDVLREKFTYMINSAATWKIEVNNEDEFRASNDQGRIWHLKTCDEVTNRLNCIQPDPCLVYRKKVEGGGSRQEELFQAVRYVQEDLAMIEIKMKLHGEICQPIVSWVELTENWYQSRSLYKTEMLKEFESLLLECIYELPEFRLYAVTGMLEVE